MAKLSLVKGTTSYRSYVFIGDSSVSTGAGLTGLVFNSGSLVASYVRPGAVRTAITLATQTVTGAYSSGGFVEVDSTNMPGIYRFDVPDAALATGVNAVVVMLKGASNMAPCVFEVELTGTDNQDAVRAGMTALPNAAAEAAGGLYTRGTGAGQINQPANGLIDVNTLRWNGTAVATPATAGIPDVNVKNIDNDAASASGTVTFPNATLASTTNIASGTITTVSGNVNGSVGSVTGAVGSVTGAVGSVTGNVGGNVTGSVGSIAAGGIAAASFAAGAIDATAIATDAIGSAEISAAAVTKIQAGLSTYAGGAVASVTGNVGGNVTGSVGSVVGAVGSVTAAVTVGTNNDKTGYALSGAGVTAVQAGLSTVTTAQVNAEVLDVLTVDTFAEPAAVVAATASLKDKIGWLAILARNKRQTTATSDVVRNDADSVTVATSTISDNGTTFVRGEYT